MNLTPEERERLMKLCEAATKGPWTVDGICEQEGIEDVIAMVPEILIIDTSDGDFPCKRDCDFIAAARTALPLALADLAALEQQLAAVTRERDEARAHARNHHAEGCLTCMAMESERDDLQRRMDAAETRVGKSSASSKDFRNGWNQCRGEFLSALARKEDA